MAMDPATTHQPWNTRGRWYVGSLSWAGACLEGWLKAPAATSCRQPQAEDEVVSARSSLSTYTLASACQVSTPNPQRRGGHDPRHPHCIHHGRWVPGGHDDNA